MTSVLVPIVRVSGRPLFRIHRVAGRFAGALLLASLVVTTATTARSASGSPTTTAERSTTALTAPVDVLAAPPTVLSNEPIAPTVPPPQRIAENARSMVPAEQPATTVSVKTVKPTPDWPRLLPKKAVKHVSRKNSWSEAETQAERSRCMALLKGTGIVAIPAEPMREDECGAAAPFELVSVGSKPQVALSPPAIVTCDMAVALNRWVGDLQPLARRHLGGEISRIDVMSSYSCRNAYGRKSTNLSEHALANAIDIRGFGTVSGAVSTVLDDWGLTGRDIRSQVAAAKANSKKNEAARAAASLRPSLKPPSQKADDSKAIAAQTPTSEQAQSTTASTGKPVNGTSRVETGTAFSMPTPSIAVGGRSMPGVGNADNDSSDSAIGLWGAPIIRPNGLARLGGPKPLEVPRRATPANAPGSPRSGNNARYSDFYRAAHVSACRLFGTVLGPEANEAHRNHFHLDLAERKLANYCE